VRGAPSVAAGLPAVLSVWKLAPGQELYYLEAVAKGVEDYYVGGEAPGRWIASSNQLLGLDGIVEPDALHHVLAGHDPSTGTQLGQPHKVPGYDLTFRAPKSVSVLFGLGDPDTARAVRDAHDEAVRSALDFTERHAVWSRRGHAGKNQIRCEGLIAAAFRHRTSRNGDPHLHSHVLVPNMVRGVDGKWATIDGRWVYTSAKTIGYLYEAQLRHNLTVSLGVEWGPMKNGIGDIVGIPENVLKAFSTRRAEIEQSMEMRGQHSPRAAMIAALDTRRTKTHDVDPVSLREVWEATAADLGFGPADLSTVLGRAVAAPVGEATKRSIEDHLLSPGGLTEHVSTFSRNDVLRAWCDSLPGGGPIGDIEALADGLEDRLEAVPLDGIATRGPVIRAANGRVLSSLPVGRRWSTFDLLNTEREALDLARRLLDGTAAVCEEEDLLAALRGAPTLSEEQRSAVIRMTMSGNGVDILTAPAGAGKTFALAAAREAWERSGYRVSGAAHTGVAADEITNAADIPSTTIARLRIAIDNSEPGGLDNRSVFIIDEAGTAGTRDLAAILDAVDRTGAKVVLVGDPKQLPEITAGGLFAGLIARQPTIELQDNRRQHEEWEREALKQLRDGDTSLALDAYRKHGRITIGDTAADTKALLVADWWAARTQGDDAIMLAGRRSEVAELNVHGRLRAELAGQLRGDPLDIGSHQFQIGDAVMTLKNDKRLGVRNGNRGVVVAVGSEARSMRVRMQRGDVDLPARYLDAGHVGHAYAMTVNKAHGLTCDRTMTLGNDQVYRELAYEALSRGRLSNHVYMPKSCTLDIEEDGPHARTASLAEATESLDRGIRRRRNKHLALDELATVPIEAWPTPDLHAEKRRVEQILGAAGPNRQRDLDSLVARRTTAVDDLAEANVEVESLTGRKRPLRERRKPDTELIRETSRADNLQDRFDRLDSEIASLETSQHRRRSHLAAHEADAHQLKAIEAVVDGRIQKAIARSVTDPPSYITKSVGRRPGRCEPDREWVRTVAVVEQYRVEHDITDKRTLLGPYPENNPFDQMDWEMIHNSVTETRQELGIERPSPPHGLGIEWPSISL